MSGHPLAAELPVRSIVATADSVYFKVGGNPGWAGLTGGKHLTRVGNADVDDLLRDWHATVLRVGGGE